MEKLNYGIIFTKDGGSFVFGRGGGSYRDIYSDFIELLDVDPLEIDKIILSSNKAQTLRDSKLKAFPNLLWGIYQINDDSSNVTSELREKIKKDLLNVQFDYKELATLYLDEDSSLERLKGLTPKQKYVEFDPFLLEYTIECSIRIDEETLEEKQIFYPRSFEELFYLLFMKMVVNNISLKRCGHCGKYFVKHKNYNNEYCNRLIPGKNKTCKDVGAVKKYKKNEDQITKIFNRAYKTYYARLTKYHKISPDSFADWLSRASQKRDEAKNGLITEEEFKNWIDSNM